MKFATWATSTSGGFLRSNVSQNAKWDVEYNLKLAQKAEEEGFYAILFPTRYLGADTKSENIDGQLDPISLASAISIKTEKLHLITAVLPGFIHPTVLAKIGSTLDHISQGRWHVNIVSGWFKEEQEKLGIPWIDHKDRYKRSEEYIEVLKGLWQQQNFEFEGEFYSIKKGNLLPFPVQKPYPPIFQGGNSRQAQELAGKVSDWYFMNGASIEELVIQMDSVTEIANQYNRKVRFAVNAFIIAKETEQEALKEYEHILANTDQKVIEQFKEKAKEAKGMWQKKDDIVSFVANNEGFKTGLIGSYEQIAKKINDLEEAGIELILLSFRYPLEELELFGKKVKPLIKKSLSI